MGVTAFCCPSPCNGRVYKFSGGYAPRTRGFMGLPGPKPGMFAGVTHPRTPGFSGATRPRTPGYFLLVQKVPKNTPRPRSWNPLSNRSPSGFDSALPLNRKILRVLICGGLLIHFACRPFEGTDESICSARLEVPISTRGDSRSKMTTRPITTSRRQKEIQWLRSAPLQASNWTKAGSGVSPAAFWSLFRRGKSDPGFGAGQAHKEVGARSPWKAESRSQPASGVTGSHPAAFPPARRRAHQPFGGRGGPIKGARGRIAPGSTAYI